jgi:hypothetical protein
LHPSWRIALLAFVCAVLALALPPAAPALSGSPAVIGLNSTSHPSSSRWYANSDPTFSWASSSPGGTFVDGYAYRLDHDPSGDPGTTVSASALAYTAQQTYPVGNGDIALVAADLNGDGRPDLVTANYDADTISVLMNGGAGTFAAAQTYTVGIMPWGLAVADFNGDSHPDIAVSEFGGNSVAVLLNKGNGTFAAPQTYAVHTHPEGIVAADLNGDGHVDLVVVNHGDPITENTVSVLMNNGGGTFAAQTTYQVGVGPAFIAIGDLNNDGYPDVAVTNFIDDTTSVLINNGAGSFAAQTTYPVGSGPACVAIADLNGDGHPDLVVANHGDGTAGVLLSNGDGSFSPQQTYKAGDGSQGIVVADLNGDGHPDLAVADRSAPTLEVLPGNGDGTFAAQQTFPVGQAGWRVAAADLNGDGHLDLAVANSDDGTVSVLLDEGGLTSFKNTPDGTWYFHVRAHDAAGDWGGTSTAQVNIDTSAPVTSTAGLSASSSPAWTNQHTVTLTASDAASGVAATYYTLDGSARQTYVGPLNLPDGVHTVTYWSVDNTGNAEISHTGHTDIDTTAPVTNATGLSSAPSPAWTRSATVTLASSDGASGVAASYYTLDGGAQTTYTAPVPLADGAHTVIYWSVDNAGNIETAHTGYADVGSAAPTTTAPGLSNTPSPAWTKNATMTLTAADAGSGVAHTYYTLDGGAQATYTAPVHLADGAHTVTYWSVDTIGTIEVTHTGYVRVDTTLPTVAAAGVSSGAWLNHAVTITLTGTDSASGAASIDYTLDGVSHTASGASYLLVLPKSPNKTHTLRYTATDAAGNVSVAGSLTVHIDTVGPVTSAKAASGRRHKPIVLKALVNDNLSPQAKSVTLTIRNSHKKVVKTFKLGTKNRSVWYSVKWWAAARGTYTYSVTATDLAGNRQSKVGSAKIIVK